MEGGLWSSHHPAQGDDLPILEALGTQALAELREWYRAADETRGTTTGSRDPLAELLSSIPDTPADLA